MATDEERRAALAERLGWTVREPELLELALTHRSFATEHGTRAHYERLEFLGDAVLGVLVAEWLYRRYPDLPEGELSRRKSFLVSASVLAKLAGNLGLGELLRLGVGEERSRGRRKPSLLADAFEAVLGALFLDGGLAAARGAVEPLLETLAAENPRMSAADAKTELQELVQARGWPLPHYTVAAESGPEHEKSFAVQCAVGEELLGVGQGSSKKQGEQNAARAALAELARREPPAGPAREAESAP
jgi:ribonuclease-3